MRHLRAAGRHTGLVTRDNGEQSVQFTQELRGRVDSSPVVAGDRVYVGSTDSRLYVLDVKTGRKLWEFNAGAPITSLPAIAAGRVVIGAGDVRLYARARFLARFSSRVPRRPPSS